MAFRRSVTARTKILYQQQRLAVPFSRIDRDDSHGENLPRHSPIFKGSGIPDFTRRRIPFGAGANVGSFCEPRNLFQDRRFAIPAAFAPVSVRKLSTLEDGPGADVAVAAPSEVAVAAADSSSPVAAIQYMIDYVHTFTGLNWWAAIVITTILFRTLLLPYTIYHTRTTTQYTLIRPQLEKILQETKRKDMTPAAVHEGRKRKQKLYNEYGVTPLTPLKGIVIGGPVFLCFCLALNNMAAKVHSFKEGGAFWFTDLTTPDAMYILPVLTALTFWMTMERNAQQGLGGDPSAKFAFRGFAALMFPVIAYFPKAILCYWTASNLYTIAYELVIKKPEVKQMLGIPDLPPPPPPSPKESVRFDLMSVREALANHENLKYVLFYFESKLGPLVPPPQQSPDEASKLGNIQRTLSPDEASKPGNQRTPLTALSGKIKNLEKELKRRNKRNKRYSR